MTSPVIMITSGTWGRKGDVVFSFTRALRPVICGNDKENNALIEEPFENMKKITCATGRLTNQSDVTDSIFKELVVACTPRREENELKKKTNNKNPTFPCTPDIKTLLGQLARFQRLQK